MLKSLRSAAVVTAALTLLVTAAPTFAFRQPDDGSAVRAKELRHPDLGIRNRYRPVSELPAAVAGPRAAELASLGVAADFARIDPRTGRWGTLMPATPLLPGAGNSLSWNAIAGGAPEGTRGIERAAWNAFEDYLRGHAAALRIDLDQLTVPGRVTVHGEGRLIQIHSRRQIAGVPVRDSFLTAVINNGNLVLLGLINWGDVEAAPFATLTAAEAADRVLAHLTPLSPDGDWRRPSLAYVPMARGTDADQVAVGEGLGHRLVWVVSPQFAGTLARWEGLVDAATGELLAFEDTTAYASTRTMIGGVYPVSNDGVAPDGVEQVYPMPFADITVGGETYFTDTGGNLQQCVDFTATTTLTGRYLRMIDTCGPVSESSAAAVLDLGTLAMPSTDCDVAVGASLGNTHATRSGFYEINRIIEMGRSHLPANPWVRAQLPATMNIDANCNASGGAGGVNFFTSGGGCANTGELAGVFDHEWGHGMDASDANPGISSPGEGIADIYASLRLNTSCIGRNFRLGNPCGGYGDPCTTCDGVRDIDWANRASGVPHDVAFIDPVCGGGGGTPCGGSTHCEGAVYAEAVWDLWNRDLVAAPYNMSLDTAREVATRLTFLGAGPAGAWFQCAIPFGGCNADGGYLNYLAADDDNADLSDGTPHMQAIYAAFNRHGIACDTPTVQDAGCAGTPTVAPTVNATAIDRGAILDWGGPLSSSFYNVYRTEGVFGCDFGKTLVAERIDATQFIDSDLANGREYSYIVVPLGATTGETCYGPASACTSVTPVAGANLLVDGTSAAVQVLTGDSDPFVDNCEVARLYFDTLNVGTGAQTNVRIDHVTSPSHPSIDASITFPATLTGSLADCASAPGYFTFRGDGLAHGDVIEFQVAVTSDELAGLVKTQTFSLPFAESDLQSVASKTFSFEADLEGWDLVSGSFTRSSTLGGGDGTSFALESSNGLNAQCDQIRSPLLRINPSSTLSLWNNYDIEPFSASTWYDRANVGLVDVAGNRSLISPDGGRLYNANSAGPGTYSGCNEPEEGWADTQATWGTSSWTTGAVGGTGDLAQVEVIYGTDSAAALRGFSFDQVTLTNIDLQVADTQSNTCGPNPLIFADGFETGDTSQWSTVVP